ncbi:family 2 glycosyl transferase [Galbibacter marinus]|uniref:Family 2 glycosyl transferase n=1 Tax=Galbibacter marinus TaxID=555500 RepID=K2QMY9_9FLAO|nr:glycosyltransferase [Galbibacter marinus]EKF56197.1 family 2 glycosyl transferase [Galbibacter marinus]
MKLQFTFIIPVYNRPEEVEELLASMLLLNKGSDFEVVLVEDGSTKPCKEVIERFNDRLDIAYYFKANSGPGDSRNYGMQKAKGNYFIILDSDCILPRDYLVSVTKSLSQEYTDCFGGPDAAHESFSTIQKAINYSMTSWLTTGGIRGKSGSVNKFQPRSFNMGLSKKAFIATGGFGKIHPGEDPDLTLRLWNAGFDTKLIPDAFVYHKRRISWEKFYMQVNKFGMTRPILNLWHPESRKITYWFPSLFVFGFLIAVLFWFAGFKWLLGAYGLYGLLIFIDALRSTKSFQIAALSVYASAIQFLGYGLGFAKSTILITFSKKKPEVLFPNLFFK